MKRAVILPTDRKNSKETCLRNFIFYAVACAIFGLDRAGKMWAIHFLHPGESISLLDGIIYLTLLLNPGAAFGLFAGHRLYLIAISLILILLTLIVAHLTSSNPAFRAGLAIMLGGAAGNLFDRLQTGYVVDFIDLRFWPVFNFADIAIVTGAFMLAVGLFARPGCSAPEDSGQGGK